jgi:RimJ/RimL family protein N-acetyltransferase
MLGPILDSERLRLEPPRPEHLPSFVQWFADPEVTRYLFRRYPPSLKQEVEWLEKIATSDEDIVWAIFLKDDGKLIGVTGLHEIEWRERHARIEISIGDRSKWGKGYATEIVRLCTNHAFLELGLEKVVASVYSGNKASLRLLEKLGYHQCGLLRRNAYFSGEWHDEWLGEILREEWKELARDRSARGRRPEAY